MKSFVTGLLVGALSCFLLLTMTDKKQELKEVKVTQVSGEKIDHSNFDYSGATVKFNTVAQGKGEIITEIPKTNIPEAKAWIENTNAVMLELMLIDRRIYGLSYLKRWNNFSAGGGALVSADRFEGVKLQAEYWFNL